MISFRPRRTALVRVCVLLAIGLGISATTAQGQSKSAADRVLSASKELAPLKLPPLPKKENPTKKFGDWVQRCTSRPGVTEKKCFLTQTVVQTKDKKKHGLLAVTVGLIGPDRKPSMGLRVPLGLGVLLPPGFKFNVPGVEPLRIVIQSCLTIGCIARTELLPEIVAAMKKADSGSLELHTIQKRIIKVQVSFKGFTAGLDSLNGG